MNIRIRNEQNTDIQAIFDLTQSAFSHVALFQMVRQIGMV